MDLNKLKKRPSYPFETIVLAVAFTPRLDAILADTKRIVDALRANLILIHVGEKTTQKEELLDNLLSQKGINKDLTRLIWMEGDTVDTILKLCKLNIVDLLIIGALEKENIFKYYLGSVARNISRKAKCSVLLLAHPSLEPKKLKKIVVNGVDNPKTIHTINTALYLAERIKVKEISVVKEVHLPTLTMAMSDSVSAPDVNKIKKEFSKEEDFKLHSIIEQCQRNTVEVIEKTIEGKPGYAISKYARTKKADLLIINSPDTHLNLLDRIFTHDIEYVLSNLPCDLLIVHSRV